jgi:hypothetical protein
VGDAGDEAGFEVGQPGLVPQGEQPEAGAGRDRDQQHQDAVEVHLGAEVHGRIGPTRGAADDGHVPEVERHPEVARHHGRRPRDVAATDQQAAGFVHEREPHVG